MSKSSYTIHGGSWFNFQALARAAARNRNFVDDRFNFAGFRAVEEHGICAVRGGSWDYSHAFARAADHNSDHPDDRYDDVGFRIMEGL